jgi:hypothetical protein
MVWPSGSVCATPCVAISPFAPGRFSTTTGWPSRSAIFGAINRARMSMPPPGGKPMTMRSGREGKAPCAIVPRAMSGAAAAPSTNARRVVDWAKAFLPC